MTTDLKYCLKKKFKLLKMLKLNQITRESFIIYRNLLNKAVKQAKELYYLKKVVAINGDVRETWKFVNSILHGNKSEIITSINDQNGSPVTGNKMADFFNDYFVNVVSNLIVNVPIIDLNPLSYIPLVSETFFFFPISSFDIQNIICKLKDKPCNLSNIPTKVIKSISYNLSEIFCFIFNNCI